MGTFVSENPAKTANGNHHKAGCTDIRFHHDVEIVFDDFYTHYTPVNDENEQGYDKNPRCSFFHYFISSF